MIYEHHAAKMISFRSTEKIRPYHGNWRLYDRKMRLWGFHCKLIKDGSRRTFRQCFAWYLPIIGMLKRLFRKGGKFCPCEDAGITPLSVLYSRIMWEHVTTFLKFLSRWMALFHHFVCFVPGSVVFSGMVLASLFCGCSVACKISPQTLPFEVNAQNLRRLFK